MELALAFTTGGAPARGYCEGGSNMRNAWIAYHHDPRVSEECIATGNTTQFGSLLPVVAKSLMDCRFKIEHEKEIHKHALGNCVMWRQRVGAW